MAKRELALASIDEKLASYQFDSSSYLSLQPLAFKIAKAATLQKLTRHRKATKAKK
jgi:hypothetical protein